MDKDTHESLSARLNINNNFRLDEFPTEKQPIVIAYLFGALSANKEIRLNWEGKTYNIEETQAGLVDNEDTSRTIDFEKLSDMLHDGAEVRIKD